jgi:hypothetical protein
MFRAERHTVEANLRAATNLNVVDCGTIVRARNPEQGRLGSGG